MLSYKSRYTGEQVDAFLGELPKLSRKLDDLEKNALIVDTGITLNDTHNLNRDIKLYKKDGTDATDAREVYSGFLKLKTLFTTIPYTHDIMILQNVMEEGFIEYKEVHQIVFRGSQIFKRTIHVDCGGFDANGERTYPITQETYESEDSTGFIGVMWKDDLEVGKSVNPDYNQNDETQPDYIKNKPDIKNSEHGGIVLGSTETNKAHSANSVAGGYLTQAGSRGYKILSRISTPDNMLHSFELSSTDGLAIGQTVSIRTTSHYVSCGTITLISGTVVEVTTPKAIQFTLETDPDDPEHFVMENYLTVDGHPELGDTVVAFNGCSFGEDCIAQERDTFSWGRKSKALGQYSYAGNRQTVAGYAAHAEGYLTKALGNYGHSEGVKAEATGDASHSEGESTKAIGHAAHAEGYVTKAHGQAAHAEGSNNEAIGISAHAEGNNTKAIGLDSHSEGGETIANGKHSHAEGWASEANADNSHAEGHGSKTIHVIDNADGLGSHAEGFFTQAKGQGAHSEGSETIANEYAAHSEGNRTEANGFAAHAEGNGTKANGKYQHVQGKYNIPDDENKYAHIVGNGKSDTERSNAHTTDWDGNACYAGTVECTGVILTSPNGTRFKLTVADDGALETEAI